MARPRSPAGPSRATSSRACCRRSSTPGSGIQFCDRSESHPIRRKVTDLDRLAELTTAGEGGREAGSRRTWKGRGGSTGEGPVAPVDIRPATHASTLGGSENLGATQACTRACSLKSGPASTRDVDGFGVGPAARAGNFGWSRLISTTGADQQRSGPPPDQSASWPAKAGLRSSRAWIEPHPAHPLRPSRRALEPAPADRR